MSLLCLLLSLLALMGCSRLRPTVKIGLIAPFEGVHRPLGYEVLAAVKLAVQERNAAGGAAGVGIELVALNDDGAPATAARQVAALAADPDVMAVIGPWQAETARAAAAALPSAGLAAIIPAALPDADLAQAPGAFRLFAGDEALAQALLSALPPGAQTTIAGPGSAWSSRLLAMLPALDPAAPSALILTGDAEAVARQLTNSPCTRTITSCLAGPAVGEPVVVQRAGAAANGLVWVTSLALPDCNGPAAAFCQALTQSTGAAPGAYAALAYDATTVLLAALDAHPRAQRFDMSRILGGLEIQGVTGIVRFDDRRSWAAAPVRLYRVDNGSALR